MILPLPLAMQRGPTWSFTFDGSPAPHHVLFTVRGQPTVARMQQMIALLHAHRPQLLLPSGKLCPIILDRRADAVPDPVVLQAWRAVLEAHQEQLSCFITLVDPERADRVLMDISLEILGQFLTPRFVTVTSWETALAEAERCHV